MSCDVSQKALATVLIFCKNGAICFGSGLVKCIFLTVEQKDTLWKVNIQWWIFYYHAVSGSVEDCEYILGDYSFVWMLSKQEQTTVVGRQLEVEVPCNPVLFRERKADRAAWACSGSWWSVDSHSFILYWKKGGKKREKKNYFKVSKHLLLIQLDPTPFMKEEKWSLRRVIKLP